MGIAQDLFNTDFVTSDFTIVPIWRLDLHGVPDTDSVGGGRTYCCIGKARVNLNIKAFYKSK